MPSTAPASYMALSTVCRPAMKERKDTPRLIHSCTTIRMGMMYASVVSHRMASRVMPSFISQALAQP